MIHIDFIHSLLPTAAVTCGLAGAVTDVRARRIPNKLTGPAILLGLVLHLAGGGWKECGTSFLALFLCGGFFLLFHLAGGMGAGDVKMIAAEACLLGLSAAGPLLLYTALSGGVMALALAIKRGRLQNLLTNVWVLTFHHSRNGLQPHPDLNLLNASTLRLPYAPAIACGCVLTLLLPFSSRPPL